MNGMYYSASAHGPRSISLNSTRVDRLGSRRMHIACMATASARTRHNLKRRSATEQRGRREVRTQTWTRACTYSKSINEKYTILLSRPHAVENHVTKQNRSA